MFVSVIIIAPAFYFAKGKQKPFPSDGVARKYHTKKVRKPKPVMLSQGMEYTVTSKGDGPLPSIGDKISVLYTGKYTNDTIFDASSRHGNVPLSFQLGKSQVIPGWDSVFIHLHAGDKAIMSIPAVYGYGARPHGSIPANSTLVFEVEVIDIIPQPTPWNAKGKDTVTTPSGLKMIVFESHPDSVMPKTGHLVTVDYSGYFLDGSMFDSSVQRGEPFSFNFGKDPVIKGWQEGVGLMHKGDKVKLIVPYTLGYGERGYGGMIPPKSTLIFDVHLIDVK